MHDRTKYEKKPWYPGLQKKDRQIWDRFIIKYPDAYREVIYNLHLGQGPKIPEGTSPELAKDFILLGQWKVDVVGYRDEHVDIIEVKPYAALSALGQISAYGTLWQIFFPDKPLEALLIVTDNTTDDVKKVYAANAISLIEVGT